MSIEDLRARVEQIHWYHTIDVGNGIRTPGVDDTPRKLNTLRMPEDLEGKSVLDVGPWDGFFSFEAERRGAANVLATDSFCWSGEGWGSKEGFSLARETLGSKVRDMEIEVHELSPETVGVFDVVLFLGVLYHLENPLLALERIHSVTGNRLILSTETDLLWTASPAMAFYPTDELNHDPTNWWGPKSGGGRGDASDGGISSSTGRLRLPPHPQTRSRDQLESKAVRPVHPDAQAGSDRLPRMALGVYNENKGGASRHRRDRRLDRRPG